MNLDILFTHQEDRNGYLTCTATPYFPQGQPAERNPLLCYMQIEEWSQGQGGHLNKYTRSDKPPRSQSVWRHSCSLTIFPTYDEAKVDLIAEIKRYVCQFVKAL